MTTFPAALTLALQAATAAWWAYVALLAVAVACSTGWAVWALWRGVRTIRRRRARQAARHRLYVRRILRAEEQRAREIETCKGIWPDAPEWGTAA